MKKSPSPLEKAGWGIGILNQKSLILETVDWSRNTTGTVYECLATEWVYRHDWSMTEQTAKIYIVAYLHARKSSKATCRTITTTLSSATVFWW
jgi:hypothetical protein